jgi:transcriptional regulator with XRE-family HTH domain
MWKNLSDAQTLAEIGQRLKATRLGRGLSQEALASAAGVSLPTVQRMESRGQATVENLIRLLRQLDLLDGLHTLLPPPRMETPGKTRQRAARRRPAEHGVRLADYPQLHLISWNRRDDDVVDEQEALALYERNWRYIDPPNLVAREKALIARLVRKHGAGVLNV